MALQSSLEGRAFQGLLTCLNKRLFGSDASFNNEFIISQLYASSDLDKSELEAEINTFEQLLLKLADEHWDVSKLERMIKKTQLSAENQRSVVNFWNSERDKIHDKMVRKSRWNRSVGNLSWRVDMKTASKTVSEINEPVALFEFGSESSLSSGPSSGTSAVRFEMDRTQVAELIATLDSIQKKIEEISY